MNKKSKPPKIPEWIIRKLLAERDFFEKSGDLDEVYYRKRGKENGYKASVWYWGQVINALPGFLSNSMNRSITMFNNYVKIAMRNILRQKGYSLINISSLAIGMACCILLLFWVHDELSYDRFNENIDNLYRVFQEDGTGDSISRSASIPTPLVPAMKEGCPEIIQAARYRTMDKTLAAYEESRLFELNGAFGDQALFDMFTFEFVKGDPARALTDPLSMVITEEFSEKYFNNDEPLGKVITLKGQYDFTVTGVIKKIPQNSSLQFEYIIPFDNYSRFVKQDLRNNWGWYGGFNGFVLLHDEADYKDVIPKIAGIMKENKPGDTSDVSLQPLADAYLYGLNGNGAMTGVITFTVLAVLTLLIACINFMNLSTARSAGRTTEIGMRKVIGARKKDLLQQFLGEAVLMAMIAFFFALVICRLMLPIYNELSGKQLELSLSGNIPALLIFTGVALITGLLAGSYPAFFLSSFQPVKALKGTKISGSKGGSSRLRKILVTAQFSISIILIICTFVVFNQLEYISNKDLGFDKEHVIYLEMNDGLKRNYRNIKNELIRTQGILEVSCTSTLPGLGNSSAGDLDWEGKPPDMNGSMNFITVDYDYFKTMDIDFIDGRPFSMEMATDQREGFIVNEEALKLMKMELPVEGKFFRMWQKSGKLIGVVNNTHFSSLHSEIGPVFYTIWPYFDALVLIKLRSDDISGTIKSIENVCTEMNSGYPFDYQFLDERIERRYSSEQNLGNIFKSFTFLAIFISCLGLLGLSSFTAQQRTKEIGIRKALGSTVNNIMILLTKEFTSLVLIANVIAWPVAYYLMNRWLGDFAFRIDLGIEIFVLAGAGTLVIAILTVSFQAVKAAIADPVDSLRYE
ncbi:MAG: FtsX-like permease family protein [bacterium]|nr:FtsX-like permease family protein [bacterium]